MAKLTLIFNEHRVFLFIASEVNERKKNEMYNILFLLYLLAHSLSIFYNSSFFLVSHILLLSCVFLFLFFIFLSTSILSSLLPLLPLVLSVFCFSVHKPVFLSRFFTTLSLYSKTLSLLLFLSLPLCFYFFLLGPSYSLHLFL